MTPSERMREMEEHIEKHIGDDIPSERSDWICVPIKKRDARLLVSFLRQTREAREYLIDENPELNTEPERIMWDAIQPPKET